MAHIGPSKGMLKKVFDPANMKKKTKSAMGVARSGGPNIKPTMMNFGKGNGKDMMKTNRSY